MDDIDLIEPTTIDEARLQMVRQLHRAVYGDVWARPESPSDVWARLLDVVRVACETTKPQLAPGLRTGPGPRPFPASDTDSSRVVTIHINPSPRRDEFGEGYFAGLRVGRESRGRRP